jgi:GntP family gluconate:H+ symporter
VLRRLAEDNAVWMFRSLFGLSTRGVLKMYTLPQSMLSVLSGFSSCYH